MSQSISGFRWYCAMLQNIAITESVLFYTLHEMMCDANDPTSSYWCCEPWNLHLLALHLIALNSPMSSAIITMVYKILNWTDVLARRMKHGLVRSRNTIEIIVCIKLLRSDKLPHLASGQQISRSNCLKQRSQTGSVCFVLFCYTLW